MDRIITEEQLVALLNYVGETVPFRMAEPIVATLRGLRPAPPPLLPPPETDHAG